MARETEYPDGMAVPDIYEVDDDEVEELNLNDESFQGVPPAHALAAKRIDQDKRRGTGLPPRPVAEPTGEIESDITNLREATTQLFFCVCTMFESVKALKELARPGLFEDNPNENESRTGQDAHGDSKAAGGEDAKGSLPLSRILIIGLGANLFLTILTMLICLIRR